MKIIPFNVNGINAAKKNDLLEVIAEEIGEQKADQEGRVISLEIPTQKTLINTIREIANFLLGDCLCSERGAGIDASSDCRPPARAWKPQRESMP